MAEYKIWSFYWRQIGYSIAYGLFFSLLYLVFFVVLGLPCHPLIVFMAMVAIHIQSVISAHKSTLKLQRKQTQKEFGRYQDRRNRDVVIPVAKKIDDDEEGDGYSFAA